MHNGYPLEEEFFQNVTKGQVSLTEIIGTIKLFLEESPNASYTLVIGTDSHEKLNGENGKKYISLVTAIVIHRKGTGGRYFWKKTEQQKIHSLREKICAETLVSLDFARNFVPELKKQLNGHMRHFDLEIHVDVGEHGQTRDMIKEVVGMVTGNGFVAKTKPDAYGASYVADRHT